MPASPERLCSSDREASGLEPLEPLEQQTLIHQWAELLCILQLGSPSISTSAEEMAAELPDELVQPVNQRLQQLGCPFQVQGRAGGSLRPAAELQLADLPSAAAA